jgi:hypothetical protein
MKKAIKNGQDEAKALMDALEVIAKRATTTLATFPNMPGRGDLEYIIQIATNHKQS